MGKGDTGPGAGEFSRTEMIAVAKAQRGVLCVLVANIAVGVVRMSTRSDLAGILGFAFILPLAMFFTYRLATGLRASLPVVRTVALCIPLVNILVLFVLSGEATKVIRAHGHEVGFLGADIAKLESGGPR